MPTATACSLPSAIMATTVSFGTQQSLAPGEVSPGHIMWDPFKTCLIAPRSTCNCGRRNGSRNKKTVVNTYRANKEHGSFRWRTFVQHFKRGNKGTFSLAEKQYLPVQISEKLNVIVTGKKHQIKNYPTILWASTALFSEEFYQRILWLLQSFQWPYSWSSSKPNFLQCCKTTHCPFH